MARAGHLLERIVSFENLVAAGRIANSRPKSPICNRQSAMPGKAWYHP